MAGPTAAPSRICVIRHGEKPGVVGNDEGVDGSGQPNEHSLTPRGWQRAGALAVLFDDPSLTAARGLATPARLFGPDYGDHTDRRRTTETLSALAAKLQVDGTNVEIEHPVALDHEPELAAALREAGAGPVLVCWEHHRIPDLADALLTGTNQHPPKPWPEERFDVIWVFKLDTTSQPPTYAFSQMPQNLLGDDADTILA